MTHIKLGAPFAPPNIIFRELEMQKNWGSVNQPCTKLARLIVPAILNIDAGVESSFPAKKKKGIVSFPVNSLVGLKH